MTFVRFQRPDPFEVDDAVLAEELAAQAAVCIDNARRYTRERATALALQRSLLPQSLTAGSPGQSRAPAPPVMVRPDRTALFPVLPAGPPLGIGALPFESAEIALPEGSLLALYTDGLIQGHEHDIEGGLSKLGDELVEPARTLEETCGNVTNALTADDRSDDVALLLARTHTRDPDPVASWDLPSGDRDQCPKDGCASALRVGP